jgi:hypothetical protein
VSSGALQVAGGVGVSGGLVVGNITTVTNTTNATSTSTGALQVAGGVGIARDLYVGGTIYGLASVSGTISTATNLSGNTIGSIPYQSAAGATNYVSGSPGQVLVSRGSLAPVFQNTLTLAGANDSGSPTTGALQVVGGVGVGGSVFVGGTVTATTFVGALTGTATTATNIAGGATGFIPYQLSSGITRFIGTGTTGSLLQMGLTTASFVSTSTIQVGYSVHLLGGTAGSVPYQSGANATTFLSISGTNGYVLTSNGTGPQWSPLTSLTITTATNANNIATVIQTENANYYPVFVNSNNATAAYESAHTTGTIYVNPSTGQLTAQSIIAAQNGTGQSLRIGDDLWIGDINVPNTIQLSGVQDSTQAYINFGISDAISLGRSGTGPLTYGGNFKVNGTTQSTSTSTGALQVVGGVGIGGNLYVGGEIVAQKLTIELTTVTTTLVTTDDIIKTTNNTNATSTITGALQVSGGAGIGRDLYVGGNVTVLGTINASVTGVISTATSLAGGLLGQIPYQTAAGVTGFIGTGTNGSILQMGANTATFVTTGSIYVGYANTATTATSAAVAYSLANTSTTYVGRAAIADNASTASQVTTVAQTANATYFLTFVDANNDTSLVESLYTTSSFTVNAASGGVRIGGVTTITNTASAISTVSGALQIVGGVGVGGALFAASIDITDTAAVRSTVNATSSSTGALQVTGGAGIGRDLWVGGTAYANVLQSTSDVNFKKDITTITNALNTVMQLRGVEYKWKHNDAPSLGLIAQEVQPLVPAAVSETVDRLTVSYGNMVGLLVEAIKEQQQQILTLQQEIRDLKR